MNYSILEKWMKMNDLDKESMMKLHDFEDFEHQEFYEAADALEFVDVLHSRKDSGLVVIDSDYDCDGVMSERILKAALTKFGFKVASYYPSEHDGYGLTMKEADHLLEKFPNVATIVTADNGINCKEAIDYLTDKGIHVLVSDHHKGEIAKFPESARVCVNVNRADKIDNYKFKHISGAQTAYKLVELYAKKYCEHSTLGYIKCLKLFASISILSDVMLIDNENRRDIRDLIADFNSKRIENMSMTNQYVKSLKNFVDRFGQRRVTQETFGFAVIPTINSSRRMLAESELAFKALDENPRTSEIAINALMRLNDLRKAEKKEALKSLDMKIDNDQIAVAVTDAKAGILGLISSDLANSKKRSSLTFKNMGNVMKASGRGFGANSIYSILENVSKMRPDLRFGFGGHSHALGCEVNVEDFEEFCKTVEESAKEMYSDIEIEPTKSIRVDIFDLLSDREFLTDLKYSCDMIDLMRPLPYYISDLKLSVKTTKSELVRLGFEYFGQNFEHFKYEGSDTEIVLFYNADLIKSAEDEIELVMSVRFENDKCKLIIEEVNV